MNFATRLKVSAEIILSITVIIMIIVATKVISSGNSLGVQILLSTLFFILFMWLGWLQPRQTGLALIILGSLVLIFFGNFAYNGDVWNLFSSPILIAGFLFLGAGWEFGQTI